MRNRLATIVDPPRLERGVYLEPVNSGGRPVLIAVASTGERIATHTLKDGERFADVTRELAELIDRFDPVPRLQLVTADGPELLLAPLPVSRFSRPVVTSRGGVRLEPVYEEDELVRLFYRAMKGGAVDDERIAQLYR